MEAGETAPTDPWPHPLPVSELEAAALAAGRKMLTSGQELMSPRGPSQPPPGLESASGAVESWDQVAGAEKGTVVGWNVKCHAEEHALGWCRSVPAASPPCGVEVWTCASQQDPHPGQDLSAGMFNCHIAEPVPG